MRFLRKLELNFATSGLLLALMLFLAKSPVAHGHSHKWFKSELAPKGVFLVGHGLNIKPSAMDFMAKHLTTLNFDVLRFGLAGHGDDPVPMGLVTRKIWVHCLKRALFEALMQYPRGTKFYFLGHSTSALVFEDLITHDDSIAKIFSAAILLAPAISVKSYNHLAKYLKYALLPLTPLPTMTPIPYRNGRNTVAGYTALFDSIEATHSTHFQNANLPTLILSNPNDWLISFEGLHRIQKEHSLSRWEIVEITNNQKPPYDRSHHLVIDETSLGRDLWLVLTSRISEFLLKN